LATPPPCVRTYGAQALAVEAAAAAVIAHAAAATAIEYS